MPALAPQSEEPGRSRDDASALQPPLRYANIHLLFVIVSSWDLVYTWLILSMGGREVNVIANAVLSYHGYGGMVAFKFTLVVLVVLLCEVIGRRNERTGRRLAIWAAAVTCFPVAFAMAQLLLV
jgi:hypothetical protein